MLKRVFDFGAAFIGVVLLAPIFGLLGIWIKLDSHGPVFYRAERGGQDRSA